jgi:hypothetical protein
MAAHPPPKPTEQTNPHESGRATDKQRAQQIERENRLHRNPREQGRQGNIDQNTTNKGYQQDR